MYIVLLSGGAGLRLWPLSNSSRSKQYIRIINDELNTENCSMLQRVWKQLEHADLAKKSIITASQGQVEIINSQLGEVNIAIEPERRDTFPAVALSCAYIKDYLGADDNESVCFIPVDPYTDFSYFETLKRLEEVLTETKADVVLMGVVPDEPSSKYGYIVPEQFHEYDGYQKVSCFREKPSVVEAEDLIKKKALWNCGVFCTKIGKIIKLAKEFNVGTKYESLYKHYSSLPKTSFDYKVLENSESLYVVPFKGLWKDLGTWNTLSEEMQKPYIGNCVLDSTTVNTHIINELDIPVVTVGAQDMMIVASYDGILIANKEKCDDIKKILGDVNLSTKYEERRWGVLKTLDFSQTEEGFTLLRKIVMFGNNSSSYHFHNERDEVLTILEGRGEIIIEGVSILLNQGSSITIPRHKKHAVRAFCDMEYLETHIGKTFGDEDINRLTFEWNEIRNL